MKSPQIKTNNIPTLITLSLLLLLIPSFSMARDVDFSWTANAEPVTGYKLYYKTGPDGTPPYDGTGLAAGDSPIAIGKVTAYAVSGLSPSNTYHFVITAINESDESNFTAPVSYQATSMASPVIEIMSQKNN